MDKRDINFTFEVFDDDMTNENWAEYRQAVIDSMVAFQKSGEASPDQVRRLDQLLGDIYRDRPATYDALGRPDDNVFDED